LFLAAIFAASSSAQLTNMITFDDLGTNEVVAPPHYLDQGVVLHSQESGYLFGAPTRQRTGQALWVNGNSVDRREVVIDFYLPSSSSPGTISEFYVYIRAPGGWTIEYWGPNGEFFGRYSSTEEGVGTSFAPDMRPHRLLLYGEVPWSDLSIDDLQLSDITPVPEPTAIAILGLGLATIVRWRRR